MGSNTTKVFPLESGAIVTIPSWLKTNSIHSRDESSSAASCDLLFVCTGNICRSAYLHARAQQLLSPPWVVASAGTGALVGQDVDGPMRRQLDARGVSYAHRARQLTAGITHSSAVVVALTAAHWHYVIEEDPTCLRRAFTAHALAAAGARFWSEGDWDAVLFDEDDQPRPRAERLASWRSQLFSFVKAAGGMGAFADVADPYRRGEDAAVACARECDEILDVLVRSLRRLETA